MPEVLAQLLEAETFFIQHTKLQGTFFIEIMAGVCVITLGVLLKRVPCLVNSERIKNCESYNVAHADSTMENEEVK